MPNIDSFFSAAGSLARTVPAFSVRAQQLEMAQAIAETIAANSILVAEAGTGTGKTFAYLVPALLAGGKVIISTGTKTLQDQLFNRDIPTVRTALMAPVTVALLKGRANYVCHYHLERTIHDGRTLPSREEVKYLKLIERYASVSKTGDKSGLSEVPENAAVWQQVTSTRDSCLGSECSHYKNCFVMEARKQALSADVVVVNHHLFFADVMLRDEGLAELLPTCNTVIFDEAHQLPETASLFFGESVSTSQLLELARDAVAEALRGAKDFIALPQAITEMEKAARDFRLTIEGENTRMPLAAIMRNARFGGALDELLKKLGALVELLESQAERSDGLENCWQRAREIAASIRRWRDQAETEGFVRWVEVFSQALQLNATPLSIAEIFNKQLSGGPPRAWIFTSATLSVKGDFTHYNNEMGLTEGSNSMRSACWESPFDFANQSLLYVPTGLREPNSPGYTEEVVKAALPVLKSSRGRAFFLCTSLRAMKRVHELLLEAFRQEQLDYPILLQGQGSRSHMLERFRKMGNAVLIGSQSFWEGVDVRGEALSVVIIDKLPFAPPDDPVLAARIDKINKEGRNAFMEYQLPRAVINLKQGAGRLIRDETDRGVLMICDPRLITKPYGKKIWQSLPSMKRTRNIAEVEDFFSAKDAVAGV
ncbi:ATP-dependent DNA helicase [Nitrosovibrio sp. Nv4]|uniref:ATP-dependent DNA helicase n=1 Tax=Nitrosovibrio sp. Nv4 TaxID=1945880 RepID=UPI000BC8D00D|nr:ATP-dependent DNA helicase [Nitrosovibrio sp. Nv4]SOD41678.1 ATP-dependent DNA helicase DinG [Nitrosovibrio sp. Nv4]